MITFSFYNYNKGTRDSDLTHSLPRILQHSHDKTKGKTGRCTIVVRGNGPNTLAPPITPILTPKCLANGPRAESK